MIKNLHGHSKSHDVSNKISCSRCSEIITHRHSKDKHCSYIVIRQLPIITKREIQGLLTLAEHIYDYNGSNVVIQQLPTITKREIQDLLTLAEHIYDYNVSVPAASNRNGLKRAHNVESSNETVSVKKTCMNIVNTCSFIKTGSSLSNKINWFYMKNTDNLNNIGVIGTFLESLSAKHPMNYNLKLEATFDCPYMENLRTDVEAKINLDFSKFISKEDVNMSYKYTPMSGLSYTTLPEGIKNKNTVINPQKVDQQVFQVGNSSKIVLGYNKDLVAKNDSTSSESHLYRLRGTSR